MNSFPWISLLVTLQLAPLLRAEVAVPPVVLTEQGVNNLGLETVRVAKADFETTTFALGRTEVIPECRSILSSRIAGRVVEHRLRVGTVVAKGDQLLLLESRQPGDPAPTVWLTAPAAGTVISVNTSLGAPVEPSDRLAEIADLSKLYLIATLPQATAGNIKPGTRAKVHFPLRPEHSFTATLHQFAACPCPDPACAVGQNVATRSENRPEADLNSAGVIFTLDNRDQLLRSGMNAECSIIIETRKGVLSVPSEAVHGDPANRHVYLKHPQRPFAFNRVNVQTGLTSNDRVEILAGLSPGDEVATRGSYSLGFAGSSGTPSLKQAMDAVHGHEHNEDGSEPGSELAEAPPGEAGHAHHADEHGDAHDHADEHGTNSAGFLRALSPREWMFIATIVVLALWQLATTLGRRRAHHANHEPS